MPVVLVILSSTLLATTPGPLLWRFHGGQEFYIEETHRQLLTVSSPKVSTYLDYSALIKYRVTADRATMVTLEATVDGIRINNVNEAGAKAVEAIKKWEKSRTTWRLFWTTEGWTAESVPPDPRRQPPYILLLGTPAVSPDRTWRQSWPADGPGSWKTAFTLEGRVKQVDPGRVRAELRASWDPSDDGAGQRVDSQPVETPGLAFFDRSNRRWEQVDFRLKGGFHANGVEVKQDLNTLYRYFDRVPWWWSSPPTAR